MFNHKSILITGGTGFFGSNFVSYLYKNFNPKRVVIFSRDEAKQYEMKTKYNKPNYKGLKFFIGDVRDEARLSLAFKDIDYVVHAAALKHVPAAEYNPIECIKTNIYGAQNVITAALKSKVKKVIALSTDKAANPINIYGATKLASDKLFVAANNLVGKSNLRFSIVRYGNVFNSRGSVVPYFRSLIKSGKKVLPVTNENMTRFFISIEEGIKFVINSFQRMDGGEIFIPKIPSIKILDLAKAMSSKYKIIGIRPGEKINEILCPSDDSHLTIEFKDHFVIAPSIKFYDKKKNYKKNKLNEKGKRVPFGFEYHSGNNKKFLSIMEIKKLVSIFSN
tara:strand:+ start:731 stop:1735 length:1005 start_codon:yes stop_codon:yes gene_type:complete